MYYIHRSPSSNNIVHVTQDKTLYPEASLIDNFEDIEVLKAWAELNKKTICWCDYDPIAGSLNNNG